MESLHFRLRHAGTNVSPTLQTTSPITPPHSLHRLSDYRLAQAMPRPLFTNIELPLSLPTSSIAKRVVAHDAFAPAGPQLFAATRQGMSATPTETEDWPPEELKPLLQGLSDDEVREVRCYTWKMQRKAARNVSVVWSDATRTSLASVTQSLEAAAHTRSNSVKTSTSSPSRGARRARGASKTSGRATSTSRTGLRRTPAGPIPHGAAPA